MVYVVWHKVKLFLRVGGQRDLRLVPWMSSREELDALRADLAATRQELGRAHRRIERLEHGLSAGQEGLRSWTPVWLHYIAKSELCMTA